MHELRPAGGDSHDKGQGRRGVKALDIVVVAGYAYGPKCAQRAGLLPRKERAHASEALRDTQTRDWVQEVGYAQ